MHRKFRGGRGRPSPRGDWIVRRGDLPYGHLITAGNEITYLALNVLFGKPALFAHLLPEILYRKDCRDLLDGGSVIESASGKVL